MITEDANLPKQKEVLQIIDCTPETEKRKAQLKKLDNGIPYHYIRQKILRYLRNAPSVRSNYMPTPCRLYPSLSV